MFSSLFNSFFPGNGMVVDSCPLSLYGVEVVSGTPRSSNAQLKRKQYKGHRPVGSDSSTVSISLITVDTASPSCLISLSYKIFSARIALSF
jgi:hypothetical protein